MQAPPKHPILLLHGALACEKQLRPLARELATHYTVRTFSFSGHGGQPLEESAFTMRQFAVQVTEFLDVQGWESAHVFGYSMGGYAALAAAVAAPNRFRSITTLGTKLDWSPATAAREIRFLDLDQMREKIPLFTAQLEQQHAPTPLAALLAATAGLMRGLGDVPLLTAQNLAELEVPVQVLVGELDKTAGVDASRHFADFMPRATFEIIFNTPHPLDKVNPDLLTSRIVHFVEQTEGHPR